jgi:2-oxoglutarate dehydrogenase complex dehydrogenase (E1) component-like enzyme
MVAKIQEHPPVREQYAQQLAAEGVVAPDEAERVLQEVQGRLREAHEHLKQSFARSIPAKSKDESTPPTSTDRVVTAVRGDRLRALNEALLRVPDGFTVHPKLARQLDRRRDTLDAGGIDWGQAEALAFASLLVEGIPVRLTGQDTERGTFSHRHLVLHDAGTGEDYAPIRNLPEAAASFEVHNSPLSENAAVGFEYGYTTAAPETLVLWEAQFGDFVNGAQVIVDQFIVSGLSKWRQQSNLTLLLPHGYEGNGPEHSSARLERFLQLAAQENIRVANCTTAAQYFHLLRRQAHDATGRPLIVMTPKGLLRLREAASSFSDLAEGEFFPVIDDPAVEDRAAVRRLVLCSGKVYYDIVGHAERAQAAGVAVARLEQLYPFPVQAAAALVAAYPGLEQFVWAQEEPQNMGAWRAIRHRLEEASQRVPPVYVGRPWRASPSEGYPTAHLVEQDRIVRAALGLPPRPLG